MLPGLTPSPQTPASKSCQVRGSISEGPTVNLAASEVTRALRNREGILIEKAADELDEVATAFERDIAVQKLDRESRLLRQILAALSRIENGTFGTCLHCDEEISRKRLAAVPWTPFCLACQEAADRGDQRVLEIADRWFAEAA
jgi:DnaK suppressor protein